jgi:hypothetical protein
MIAGFAASVRNYNLEKPPSVSEMIDIANACRILGVEELTDELRDVLLPILVKTDADRRHLLLRSAFQHLLHDGHVFAQKLYAAEQDGVPA